MTASCPPPDSSRASLAPPWRHSSLAVRFPAEQHQTARETGAGRPACRHGRVAGDLCLWSHASPGREAGYGEVVMGATRQAVSIVDARAPATGTRIDLDELCRYYRVGDTTVKALDQVNLHVDETAFVVVLGTSGSGKTTLL